MTCEELYRRLTEHFEGALDGPSRAELEEHLAACWSCQQIRRDLEDLQRLCRELPVVRLPGDVRGRIQTLLRA